MKYIDFHCDTLCTAFFQKKDDLSALTESMVDLDKMKAAECAAQFFAIYMMPEEERDAPHSGIPADEAYIAALRQILLHTQERFPESIALCRSGEEMRKNEREGKISAFLTLEDGRAVQGRMENLERFYEMGVRLISLTWNFDNCFGHPNSYDPHCMAKGLAPFGKDAVCRMQELGMLVDVSHLSDGGFWDIVDICKKPFVASHSNCRSLCPHSRNLTDKMLRALADRGGVAGLNFCPAFLMEDVNNPHSTAAFIAHQACYMANCGGMDCVALGTDFDGIHGDLEIDGPHKLELLWEALRREGFSWADVERIAWKNAERLIKETVF